MHVFPDARFDVQFDELAQIGAEQKPAHQDEHQQAQNAGQEGSKHVDGIIDRRAGKTLVCADGNQGQRLERYQRHAELAGENSAYHHHHRVAFMPFIPAEFEHAVHQAPVDDACRRGAGQPAENGYGQQQGKGQQPWPSFHAFAADKPHGNPSCHAMGIQHRAEHEYEYHHHDRRIAEPLVEERVDGHDVQQTDGKKAYHAGPDDIYENPRVHNADERAEHIHAVRRYGRDGFKPAEEKCYGEKDSYVKKVLDINGTPGSGCRVLRPFYIILACRQ